MMKKKKFFLFGKNTSIIFCLIASMLFLSCATMPKEIVSERQAKIAVVLGAGASKGFAHIGVLKVLESQNVPIHMIVGTSVGSFVGSLYAYGYSAYELQTIAINIQRDEIVDIIIPDNGFIRGEKLENYVNTRVQYTPMEKLKIPFYAVATNIQNGEEMIFGRGNTGKAVRASCAIPGVFNPVLIAGNYYVDGGVVNPLAADVARRFGADVVIAVDISAGIQTAAPKRTLDTILQAIGIMHNKLGTFQIRHADVVISPKVGYIVASDFSKRHEGIMDGEKAALEAMPAINKILDKLRQEGRL